MKVKLKDNQVIDLSPTRKQEIRWLGANEIDKKLLFECAYYPKAPAFGLTVSSCINCSFENPAKNCPYSHILTFSEDKPKTKIRKEALRLIESLSEEDREAVIEYLRKRNEAASIY